MFRRHPLVIALSLALAAGTLSGCATKEFVDERVQGLDARLDALRDELTQARNQAGQAREELNQRIASQETGATAQRETVTQLATTQATMQEDLARQALNSAALAEAVAEKAEVSRLASEVAALKASTAETAETADATAAVVRAIQTREPETTAALEQRIVELAERLDGQIVERTEQVTEQIAAQITAQTERIEAGEVRLARLADQVEIQTKLLETEQARNESQAHRLNEQADRLADLAAAEQAALTRDEGLAQALTAQEETLRALRQRIDDVDYLAEQAFATAERLDALSFKGDKLAEVVLQFTFNSATLSPLSLAALDGIAEQAKTIEGEYAIELRGFTDVIGSEAYNLRLGQRRAEAVRLHLTRTGGVPLHRLYLISHGELDPIADNKKRSGRIENRRVSITLLR